MQDIKVAPIERPPDGQFGDPIKDIYDLVLVNNDLQIINEGDALIQKIIIKLKFVFAEWYLDTTKGIKFFDIVFVKNPNINLIESTIKATIVEEEEILSLTEFSSEYNSAQRTLLVNFRAESIYGEIILEQEFTI